MLETGIRKFLIASLPAKYQNVSGIVRQQESPLPEILITRSSTTPQTGLCGTFNFRVCEITIDSYSMTGDELDDMAKSLRNLLTDFEGSMGDSVVKRVLLANEFPLTDPEPGVIRWVQLYTFWYLED